MSSAIRCIPYRNDDRLEMGINFSLIDELIVAEVSVRLAIMVMPVKKQ